MDSGWRQKSSGCRKKKLKLVVRQEMFWYYEKERCLLPRLNVFICTAWLTGLLWKPDVRFPLLLLKACLVYVSGILSKRDKTELFHLSVDQTQWAPAHIKVTSCQCANHWQILTLSNKWLWPTFTHPLTIAFPSTTRTPSSLQISEMQLKSMSVQNVTTLSLKAIWYSCENVKIGVYVIESWVKICFFVSVFLPLMTKF